MFFIAIIAIPFGVAVVFGVPIAPIVVALGVPVVFLMIPRGSPMPEVGIPVALPAIMLVGMGVDDLLVVVLLGLFTAMGIVSPLVFWARASGATNSPITASATTNVAIIFPFIFHPRSPFKKAGIKNSGLQFCDHDYFTSAELSFFHVFTLSTSFSFSLVSSITSNERGFSDSTKAQKSAGLTGKWVPLSGSVVE